MPNFEYLVDIVFDKSPVTVFLNGAKHINETDTTLRFVISTAINQNNLEWENVMYNCIFDSMAGTDWKSVKQIEM